MPHISTAMERSVRRGVGDIIVASLRSRDIIGEASTVKNSFSSWSNCMAASYCKWPVIIIIVIGSLIVLSIVTCIARCCCCGYSCCCSCFSFLKCCDCCGDSCAGKKDKPMKHLDDPYYPPPRQGYQAPAPMMTGAAFGAAAKPGPPQYAQFEVGKSGLAVDPKASGLSEDALPPMPSWETATKKHVLTEEEKNAVELGELDPATGQKIPLMTGAAPTGTSMPPSPVPGHSPYGAPGQAIGGAYSDIPGEHHDQNQAAFDANGRAYGGAPAALDPYAQNGRGYGGVVPPADAYAQNQGAYDVNGRGGYGTPAAGPGRGGPGRAGPGRGYGPQNPDFPGQGRGYGAPQQDPYSPDAGFAGGAAGGYGRPQPSREYSNNSNNTQRPFPAQPQRQYSDSSRPLNPGRGYSDRPYPGDNYQQGRIASPPLNNNSGFDFGTNNQQSYSSRPSPPPQQMSYESSSPGGRPDQPLQGNGNGYSRRSPNQQSPQEQSYPGYRPYQAPGQATRGPMPSSAPGRGPREPQKWDPVRQ
ncbi:hypothetical protein N431DRAFT_17902 [Stipitochalara longipes BDJ]|nr:hypothetical protein N431DRAFT_17902 [Stipitochalara longipes BDJ]